MRHSTIAVIAMTMLCSLTLSAESVDAFIQKVRSQLGTEDALNSVKSIHYKGKVISPTGEESSELELIFQAPNYQLLRETNEKAVNQTAVNGYEGYVMSYSVADPNQKVIRVLAPAQVKRLMANAVENLNFFNGPKKMRKAIIEDGGQVDYNGQTVRKLVFDYPVSGLSYTRYFDPKSGKLLATTSSDGLTMVEKSSLVVDGVKFPKSVDTYDDTGALLRTVEFDTVIVNGDIAPDAFDFPN
ncbi:MAG: hypothetical protein AAFX93_12915 [Verrucomicrobiota bacterium]